MEESVQQPSEPLAMVSDAVEVSIDSESGVPSKETVLEFLRDLFDDDPEFAKQKTSDIADYYNVDHFKLYNHESSTGRFMNCCKMGL